MNTQLKEQGIHVHPGQKIDFILRPIGTPKVLSEAFANIAPRGRGHPGTFPHS